MLSLTFFTLSLYADPPGLQNKGGAEFPRGLESHEKTPGGWEKGEKHGWSFFHHHHKHHKHYNFDDRDR